MNRQSFDLAPGRALGSNYHIVGFLGGGWEGEVYKVEENRTGIVRAAKLFFTEESGKRAALLRYARKLYKLRSCPIIIQYHHRDSARIYGRQVDFLVSDFVDGEMLSSYLDRRKGKRLPVFEAFHLLYSLALGVEQIHFLGEYHGDIHSDNIMVKKRGLGFDVHLVDFLDLGRSSREKIQGDVFSMIFTFYEMIGGAEQYQRAGKAVRNIILGRRHDIIERRFKMAGHLRVALENLDWDD
jgi:serine/threonine protein kinase